MGSPIKLSCYLLLVISWLFIVLCLSFSILLITFYCGPILISISRWMDIISRISGDIWICIILCGRKLTKFDINPQEQSWPQKVWLKWKRNLGPQPEFPDDKKLPKRENVDTFGFASHARETCLLASMVSGRLNEQNLMGNNPSILCVTWYP